MHGRLDYFKHWLRCFARRHWPVTIAAPIIAAVALGVFVQGAWWVIAAGLAGVLVLARAAAVTYELHVRVVHEARRLIDLQARRCAGEVERQRQQWYEKTALMRLDVQVLRDQVADLKKEELRALKLARQQLDAALTECKTAYDDPGLSPNAVLVNLSSASQKVRGVLKPERSEVFAELTTQYARLMKHDESTGGISEDGLTREQIATLRRATVAPSIEWLRDTIQQLAPEDLDIAFKA